MNIAGIETKHKNSPHQCPYTVKKKICTHEFCPLYKRFFEIMIEKQKKCKGEDKDIKAMTAKLKEEDFLT